jgi:hypothetical protein
LISDIKETTSNSSWEEGRVMKIDECVIKQGKIHGTCPTLVECNEYQFRIKAVNIGKIIRCRTSIKRSFKKG